MTYRSFALPLLSLALLAAASSQAADIRGIPLKPDPPISVDGDVGEWAGVPNAMTLDRPEQVVWGSGTWSSPADLSGTVRLAWRQEYLFVVAEVTDDALRQSERGANMWKGDHIELYVDAAPDLDSGRDTFGEGQFHLGFSPGNFKNTGDPLTDCSPEAVCFAPQGTLPTGTLVAAQRKDDGWVLEAAVPWSVFGIDPEQGLFLRVEVGISDTDSDSAQQETLMTTSDEKWSRNRSRYPMASLAAADGVPAEDARGVPVFDTLEMALGESTTVTFTSPAVPEGRLAVLSMWARLKTPKPAGHTPALRLCLNDTWIPGDRLLNKPLRVKARNGAVYSMYAGDRLTTYYSPDFKTPDIDPHYGLVGNVKPCLFELDVTDLVREGENELIVSHAAAPNVKRDLTVAEGTLSFRRPPPPEKAKAGPPTGPLPVIAPRRSPKTAFEFKILPDARIAVTVAGETFIVESRFSCPKPAWVHGSCDWFKHEHRVERTAEGLAVFDTFTNLTDANLALMHRHEAHVGDGLKRLWLAGLEQPGTSGKVATPANSTSYGATDTAGIGLVACDDVFRVHVANYGMPGIVGVADNELVLPPGESYTAEWLIIPTETPDYWRFINAARRQLDVNWAIDGGFAFLRAGHLTEAWSDKQLADFIRFKDPLWICSTIPSVNGRYAHGTMFQQLDHSMYARAFTRWRTFEPDRLYTVYFHCFLDVTDEGPERFADARTLLPDGNQADYGKPHQRLYIPTESNAYGEAVAKHIDIIYDTISANGVYWDEHEYSRVAYHYGKPWDGCSGDIDAKTMQVTRLKSSVNLLSEPWRVALAKRIQERGTLTGNGAPYTRAMMAQRFPCFVETGSITNCARSHLYTPIALGDHLTERSEEDAYGTMLAALDYGCVYHWYNDMTVIPTHPHLTSYMFPITPMELHEGYIIGDERIVANKSGLFGWNDASRHEVHVFNDEGCEVGDFEAPTVTRDGNTYTELRIAEDWSAAIVRVR